MSEAIYKIAEQSDWQNAQTNGTYRGSPHDLRDGFIHFSTASQLNATAKKHFATQDQLLLLAVDPAQFDEDLKWEPSRGGDLFPHLYAPLSLDQISHVRPLKRDKTNNLILPEGCIS